MNKKFTVEVCSDLDYEDMVADISYQDHAIATISQEKGIDNMDIEIFSPSEKLFRALPLNDFLEVVLFAKKCLIDTQKPSED